MPRLITYLFLLLCAFSASAQSVSLQVNPQVAEGQKFMVTVQVNDMEAEAPEVPKLQNCSFIYGPSKSIGSSYSNINGKVSSTQYVSYSYTFRADKASTITIPVITVTDTNGKKYTTKSAKLTILPPGQRPQRAPNPFDIFDEDREPVKVNPNDHFSADDMFVRISVNKSHVYEQEPVVATIKLYTHQNISKFQMIEQPTFEGFLSEELEVSNHTEIETINGKEYSTIVLKRCVLYPQRAGRLSLSSGTYEVTLYNNVVVNTGSFIPDVRTVEKQMRTTPNVANINVEALPTPQPLGFDGAVGEYTATAELSSLSLHTNEPTTYTLKVTGTGNIKYLKTPDLQVPAGMDLYTPKTDIDAKYANGSISGTYTVLYTIVPQEVGTFTIPPLDFVYFNPSSGEYKTITLQSFDVNVAKGVNSGVVEQRSVAKGMTDILHIHPGNYDLKKSVDNTYRSFGYWLLYIILTLALVVVIIVYRRQLRLNADVKGRRLARALRKAMKRFKKARAAMSAHDSERFYADINQALWGYIGDKLGIPASMLMRDNIAAELANYGVDQQGIDNVINILDECEMARFTPMHSDSDMSEVYQKVVNVVKSIENAKK